MGEEGIRKQDKEREGDMGKRRRIVSGLWFGR